ncbi:MULTISPECIES: nuclear transport factor 2 family protein [unclassified Janthinobacterium]|uniref:nuclear transport factor 2 family protein n=1 Tax=unclassified Janthinobacterium TaxID=2610881 RepID=UPI0008F5250D|nr:MULTISPECIES: nuclear transport factor 2 family protein [unclassified Janthinobacterium]APA70111.1 isomerase [Janthinobacterium sp. 1_2014MBL_MicDiv]MDN2713016.1 nuclear transport factor 2 family protein [Janthinobacterium sp. SUN118]
MTQTASVEGPLARLVAFYEHLSLENLAQLGAVYAPDACFKDPFNDVVGHAAILAIFEHMFVQVDAPRFIVLDSMGQGRQAFLTWEFRFRMKRRLAGEQCIRGATHIRFDTQGRVVQHRDYWDVAEELYEKLPLLGGFMRMLKRAGRR